MSKQYEQIRVKIAKHYNDKIKQLEKSVKDLEVKNDELNLQNQSLIAELQSKSEWIERLLEYCQLSEEELKQLIEAEQSKKAAYESMSTLFGGFNSVFSSY